MSTGDSINLDDATRKLILLSFFQRLPTEFLLGAARFACREWKTVLESDAAQRQLWQSRANYLEIKATAVATQCAAQGVVFESHREAEKKHTTLFTALDRCLHYYSRILLWQTQRRICGDWMADFYVHSAEMHRYWNAKHARVERLGPNKFNETDTDTAARTVSASRAAALDLALQTNKNVPFVPPL